MLCRSKTEERNRLTGKFNLSANFNKYNRELQSRAQESYKRIISNFPHVGIKDTDFNDINEGVKEVASFDLSDESNSRNISKPSNDASGGNITSISMGDGELYPKYLANAGFVLLPTNKKNENRVNLRFLEQDGLLMTKSVNIIESNSKQPSLIKLVSDNNQTSYALEYNGQVRHTPSGYFHGLQFL